MFKTNVVAEIKTHILCSVHFSENHAIYEIMWDNMVEPDRPHSTISYGAVEMRFACRIPKTKIQTPHAHNII